MHADTPMKRPVEGSNPPAGHADTAIVADTAPKGNSLHLSPRESRVAHALAGTFNWISREQLDRTAGASNSPDVVFRLRVKLGKAVIETRLVDAVDRDGKPCRPGQYRLAEQHRAAVAALLAEV